MRRVGIIGGGQLGLMLGLAGRTLGVDCRFLDPAADPPARRVGLVLPYAYDDLAGLRELAAEVEVITYENENVPVDAIDLLLAAPAASRIEGLTRPGAPGAAPARIPGGRAPLLVQPPTAALRHGQDRLREKRLFRQLDIPTAEFLAVADEADLATAVQSLGLPLLVKTRRLGYDGKGLTWVRSGDDVEKVRPQVGRASLIAEQVVEFDCEVSIFGARNRQGDIVTYPLTENRHQDGILRTSRAPAGSAAIETLAIDYLKRLLDQLAYVGVLALECFVVGGRLLANEFAPRVHNSGHWTIEGAATSQFENHLRAVLGMPLGDTAARGHAAMVNLIGAMPRDAAAIVRAGYFLHDYGKEARPGRKLGHITLLADSPESRERKLEALERLLAT